MPVKEADPQARSLDEAFEQAMGAAPKPKEPAAPPVVDHDAPFGRDDNGDPIARYGLNKDGSIRRGPQGRKAKSEDKARVSDRPAAAEPGKEIAVLARPGQYNQELADTADTIWFGLSALGKAGPNLPLVGKLIPGTRLQAQAAVWLATKDRAVAAVSLAAEHNAAAARFAAKLEGGDITWMITCVSLVAPIVSLSGMVWAKDADLRLKEADQPTLAELVAKNETAMNEAVAQMTAQAAQLAEQEAAAASADSKAAA